MPTDETPRKAWLRDELARTMGGRDLSSLEHRVALLDEERRLVAGALAHPIMIALASIDRTETAVVVDGARAGALVVATPQDPADTLAVAFLIDQQSNLMLIAAIGVALSALAAALVAANFRRPIRAQERRPRDTRGRDDGRGGARRQSPAPRRTRRP